ncbi:MAG: LysM peptidoglycan-binding domain-containing protein [Marivita sp.]|uniref:LysM peptidoglycan-binding domain-containing protein n=1 Tax=Marivita sp. TaxID=2003365 RepID=UPI003EF9087C
MTDAYKTSGLIRMALMGTAFLALTIILVVFQPGSPRNAEILPDPATQTSVTRTADPMPSVTAPTRDIAVVAPVIAPVRSVETPSVQAPQDPTNMRDMTFSAISNLKSVTTGEAPAPGEPGSLLHSVVQRSIASAPAPSNVTQIEPVRTDARRAPTSGSYFVRPGDTLLSIARDVYGNTEMSGEIFRSNSDIMPSQDSLKPGMVLKLPTR